VGGFIHKPFSNETIWSFGDRKNTPMTFLIIMDEIRYSRNITNTIVVVVKFNLFIILNFYLRKSIVFINHVIIKKPRKK
jgi:hypothetical protein